MRYCSCKLFFNRGVDLRRHLQSVAFECTEVGREAYKMLLAGNLTTAQILNEEDQYYGIAIRSDSPGYVNGAPKQQDIRRFQRRAQPLAGSLRRGLQTARQA